MMNDTTPSTGGTAHPVHAGQPALRKLLREGSGDRHERLDRRFEGMHAAEGPQLYHLFIEMNAACHAAIEPILDASPLAAEFAELRSCNRAAVLEADRDAMALRAIRTEAFPIPHPDLAEAIGIAYVLEGSRLGARYLHRLVRERLPQAAWSDVSLLYFESAAAPDRFRDFMASASSRIEGEPDRIRAVAAANATFDYFMATVTGASHAANGPSSGREAP